MQAKWGRPLNEQGGRISSAETKSRSKLKGSSNLWLKNDAKLTAAQRVERGSLAKANVNPGRARALRLTFLDI